MRRRQSFRNRPSAWQLLLLHGAADAVLTGAGAVVLAFVAVAAMVMATPL